MEVEFQTHENANRIFSEARMIVLPNASASKREVLEAFAEGLGINSYFGYNWDALEDALKALNGIDQVRVTIIHPSFPVLRDELDQEIYFDVLDCISQHWSMFPEHRITLVFNPGDCYSVNKYIARRSSI